MRQLYKPVGELSSDPEHRYRYLFSDHMLDRDAVLEAIRAGTEIIRRAARQRRGQKRERVVSSWPNQRKYIRIGNRGHHR